MSEHAHGTTVFRNSGLKQPYHLVDPSPWPIVGAVAALLIVLGIIFAAHFSNYTTLVIGVLLALTTMFFWWRTVVAESRIPGAHTAVVRLGLRYGMMFFIISEVMFFVAFFWAFFNYALFPENVAGAVPAIWPPPGVHSIDPLGLPILNTMILLLSGTTVT
ncbi:MAG: cytochrome c oxidase subunit 3, partial [Acetobacteraceae bacterium]